MKRTVALLAVVLLALVLAGCSRASTNRDKPDQAGMSGTDPSSPAKKVSEIDALMHGDAEQRRILFEAEQAALKRCMEQKGFSYTPIPYSVVERDNAAKDRVVARPGDVEYARLHGYGLVEHEVWKSQFPEPTENDKRLATMSESQRMAWQRAFMGDPGNVIEPEQSMSFDPGSCTSMARTEVYGDVNQHANLEFQLQDLQRQVFLKAREDQRVRDSLEQWKKCMAQSGYDFESPEAALESLYSEFIVPSGAEGQSDNGRGPKDVDALKSKEIKVATADAECTISSNLERVRQDAMSSAEEEVLKDNQGLVVAYLEMMKTAIDKARQSGLS
jgi:hypothetical protein